MRFFFPDSLDLVDPGFDFHAESYSEFRVRQRDDQYAHELLQAPPFDGILVSKAIVDGVGANKPGKYSVAQRHRLRRVGARDFFRAPSSILFMGDCGAFSYKDEDVPPYSVDEVVEFYDECRFDFGISVDHLVPEFSNEDHLPGFEPDVSKGQMRQDMTLELAEAFFQTQKAHASFKPLGVAQGWSPSSYALAVQRLQDIGYDYIAVGGLVPLRTPEILACLDEISRVRRSKTRLHLLGVTRLDHLADFARYGVTSFDSTSPLLQAFKDNKDNYYTVEGAFPAVRVPQVDGNAKLRAAIRAGTVDGRTARVLEQEALARLRAYDRGDDTLDRALAAVRDYTELIGTQPDRSNEYKTVLRLKPWKDCSCAVCRELGIEVILFRGSERNKRRGFHNLHVFGQRLQSHRASAGMAANESEATVTK